MAYSYGSDDDDQPVVLGTPFAPLEDDQIVSKKPELDLTVRDAQGRRRFHGAFTGGFSAGHYMTVGSEEGFTPQQFVSNRHQRWDQSLIERKPENFMDSEDMDVFGIAPKRMTTKDKFSEQQQFAGFRKTDSLVDVLKSVIQPTVESIGIKLYKRMKYKAKNDRKYCERKVYGCEDMSNTSANNELSLTLYKSKSDFHGIGYKSIAEESDSNQNKTLGGISAVFKSGRKLAISGEAFGYGALDEDIEEDAVVYQKDDMSNYDFEIGSVRQHKDKNKHKAIDVLKSDVIEGFVKSFEKINLLEKMVKTYPKPILPKDWRKSSVQMKARKSRWDKTSAQEVNTSTTSEDKTHQSLAKTPAMNANMRAIILGEEVIHRHGVKKVDSSNESTIASSAQVIDRESVIKNTKESFLVNKPLSGFWANKFTRSSDGPEMTLSGGLTEFNANQTLKNNELEKDDQKSMATKRTTYEWHPHHLLCKRFNIPNPFPQFPDFVGIVTVGKSDVRNRTSLMSVRKDKQNIFDCLLDENVMSNNTKTNDLIKESNDLNETNVKVIENKNISDKEEEISETIRPEMDLFKAIFASDEESDAEDNDNESHEEIVSKISESVPESKEMDASSTKTSGIFANIDFDLLNRDFNPVLDTKQSQAINKCEVNDSIENHAEVESKASIPDDNDLYGPSLPPDYSVCDSNTDYSAMNWSQTEDKKKNKRKKKDKKHKKQKKQKTNHKHKRHRKASTSSSDSSSDIDSKIINRIKSVRK